MPQTVLAGVFIQLTSIAAGGEHVKMRPASQGYPLSAYLGVLPYQKFRVQPLKPGRLLIVNLLAGDVEAHMAAKYLLLQVYGVTDCFALESLKKSGHKYLAGASKTEGTTGGSIIRAQPHSQRPKVQRLAKLHLCLTSVMPVSSV